MSLRSFVRRTVRDIRARGSRPLVVHLVQKLIGSPPTRPHVTDAPALSALRARAEFELKARARLTDFLGQPAARLRIALAREPAVSIVVLTFNRAEYTLRCLESILSHADVPYELVIVDNASRDDTHGILERLENVTVLRNSTNAGFGGGCNQGARTACGRYLLLLNNDAELRAGSLSALVETLARFPDCGAVGGKIVGVDGRLQEAGSIVWDDGGAQGYGRHGDPTAPEYSYLREVDYCSAAYLLVRRDVWDRIGGFDPRYHPAYFEDVDLCMAIRARGFRVLYQPLGAVLHQEYTSSSPEAARALMVRNRARFAEKWARELRAQPSATTRDWLSARDRAPYPNVLFIDDRVESPDFGSGQGRSWAILTMLLRVPRRVTYIPLLDPTPREPSLTRLQQMGIEVMAGSLNFEEFAAARAGFYQTVIVSRPHNMHSTHDAVRRHFPGASLVYDAEALYFAREELRLAAIGRGLGPVGIRHQRALEATLLRAADMVVAVSEHEREMIVALVPDVAPRVVVWGYPVSVCPTPASYAARADLLLVGSFSGPDSPNEHAVLWFLDYVFPLVAGELSCTFRVVGRAPEALQGRSSPVVDFAGFVTDLEPEYDRHRVFVVPHQFSAGIPLKLVEAMSRGLPAVVSELTARQLGLQDGEGVLVGRTPEEFAAKIALLYRDPVLWRELRERGLRYVAARCAPDVLAATLRDLVARADQSARLR